jgi:hypothetical protein
MGAAGSVFKRARPGLSAYVLDDTFIQRRNISSAVATPGFDAGVRRLNHELPNSNGHIYLQKPMTI